MEDKIIKLNKNGYILAKDLKVMDSTAASLCKDNKLDLIVFNMNTEGNIVRAVKGDKIGTLVTCE